MKKMMEDIIIIEKGSDTMEERISLAAERIREFPEPLKDRQLRSYFSCLRDFILLCEKERKELRRDRTVNEALYRDMRPENYPQSWLDPAFAAANEILFIPMDYSLGNEMRKCVSMENKEITNIVKLKA